MTAVLSARERLVSDLAVTRVGPDYFRADLARRGAGRVFGGQLAGQALQAASATVEEDRLPTSIHTHFLRPAASDEVIRYSVARPREGRRFSTRVVGATQHAGLVTHSVVAYQLHEEGPDLHGRAPQFIEVEEAPSFDEWWEATDQSATYGFMGNKVYDLPIQVRVADAQVPSDDPERPVLSAWLRVPQLSGAGPATHAAALAYATDVTLGVVATLPDPTVGPVPLRQSSSLDHNLWFHRPVDLSDWLFFRQARTSMFSNRAMTSGEIYDVSGCLVATVSQECLVRYLDEDHAATAPRETPSP